MPYHLIQSSYNGGELSRRLQSRSDTAIYKIAASEILNMVPSVEGALVKRSGTRRRAAALASASWLSEFIFNATQAYVLEWSEGKIRFVTNNALLEDEDGPVEVAVPYSAADASLVSIQQSKDVLYMAHAGHPHAELRRTAADAFEYAALSLTGGPFGDRNRDASLTVTASGVSGAITITATGPIFKAGHVGAPFRIEAEDFADIQQWQIGIDDITVGTLRRNEGRVYQAVTSGRTGNSAPTHTVGIAWDGSSGNDINGDGPYGVQWRYLHDRFGVVTITGFTSTTQVTGTVQRRLPNSVTSVATERWAHGLFSAAEGWPHLVILWRGRLWFFRDFMLAGSVSGSYRDFSAYDESGAVQPDQGIVRQLDIPDKPLWVRADRQSMIIGTTLGEYAIGPINASEPISTDNIQVVPQSAHGSAQVWPVRTATEVVFAQRGARKIRAARYDFGQDRYIAPNLTLWARHMTQGGTVQMTYQAEPEELLWVLRGDGTAAAHPYNVEQDVKGWSRALAIEGSAIKSLVSIPSPDGGRDDLWLLVERDGAKTIEQLHDWWDEDAGVPIAEGFFVDSGVTFTGAATDTFSVPHLAGEEVLILANGAQLPIQTVGGDGTIVLPIAATPVTIGRPYTARYTSLRAEVPRNDGTSQGRHKRIVALVASLIDSFAVVAGSLGDILDRIVKRPTGTPMPGAPPMFTGWTDSASIGGGNDKDGRVTMEDRSPFPWILAATVAKIEGGDR
jgi:hypothetical protein